MNSSSVKGALMIDKDELQQQALQGRCILERLFTFNRYAALHTRHCWLIVLILSIRALSLRKLGCRQIISDFLRNNYSIETPPPSSKGVFGGTHLSASEQHQQLDTPESSLSPLTNKQRPFLQVLVDAEAQCAATSK
jgi:hypothetical protein